MLIESNTLDPLKRGKTNRTRDNPKRNGRGRVRRSTSKPARTTAQPSTDPIAYNPTQQQPNAPEPQAGAFALVHAKPAIATNKSAQLLRYLDELAAIDDATTT